MALVTHYLNPYRDKKFQSIRAHERSLRLQYPGGCPPHEVMHGGLLFLNIGIKIFLLASAHLPYGACADHTQCHTPCSHLFPDTCLTHIPVSHLNTCLTQAVFPTTTPFDTTACNCLTQIALHTPLTHVYHPHGDNSSQICLTQTFTNFHLPPLPTTQDRETISHNLPTSLSTMSSSTPAAPVCLIHPTLY